MLYLLHSYCIFLQRQAWEGLTMCAGDMQRCGRGDATARRSLPPSTLTQKRVHCPVLIHWRFHCKELSPPFQGEGSLQHKMDQRIFVSYLFSLLNNPLFPYTNLDPQEPCQPIDNLSRLLSYFFSR
jgi:hypothetical protein